MALSAGTRLGPYEVLAPLGAGGMGEVYRARDKKLDRDVAIKVLPESIASDPDSLARFEREAKAVAALSHPNILSIFDFGTHDGISYAVMELLEGETLRGKLRAGSIPRKQAVDYALQIAKGAAAAHEKGIVHRDLKPENLFITKDGQVKILDFGLAKRVRAKTGESLTKTETASDLTKAGAVMGTVGYMSPEQVTGESVDHRSDIFSFGTIVYEMISGRNPFRRATSPETMTAILNDDPPELATARGAPEPSLERLLRHCLEKDANHRFQSTNDLVFDLEARLPTGELAPGRARVGRRLGPLFLGALGLIAIAATLVALRARRLVPAPVYERLTFQRGFISSARFSPDGRTIVYGAAWDGWPVRLFSTRADALESRSLGLPDGDILCISSRDEMGLLLRFSVAHPLMRTGTLAKAPLAGGAARDLLDGVRFADWSPDGEQLAVAREVGGKNRLEFPIGRTLLETSDVIACPRVAPDGELVAFLDQPTFSGVQGKVSLVDGKGTIKSLTDEWRSVFGLAWSPRGDEIWFTAAKGPGGRALYSVTPSGRVRLVAASAGDLTLHDIARDGRVLLAQETSRHGVLAFRPGDSKERELSWLDASFGTDLSRDGTLLVGQEVSSASGSLCSVYIRRTDGSPAVRLGDGAAGKLSPDGKWVAAVAMPPASELLLLPTGPGASRKLPRGNIERYLSVNWMPDGKRVVFSGAERGHGPRLYVQSLDREDARALTSEGFITAGNPVSPDGSLIVALGPALAGFLVPTDGGEPRSFPGLEPGEIPIRWRDDRHLYVGRIVIGNGALKTYIVEPSSGRRELWKEIAPRDPAGLLGTGQLLTTPDGTSYAYSYHRFLSELYVVDGLK